MTARMAECKHELDPRFCSVCSGRDKANDPDPADLGRTVRARYPGKCACCGDDFPAGTLIQSDGAGGYVRAGCPS